MMGNDSAFNTGESFATTFPSYSSQQYSANFGETAQQEGIILRERGPAQHRRTQGIVNAFTLDGNVTPISFSDTIFPIRRHAPISARVSITSSFPVTH